MSPRDSLAASLVLFGRLLKKHGLPISVPAMMDALRGVRAVGVSDPQVFKTVLKAVFLTRVEETYMFDRVFEEYWRGNESEDLSMADEGSNSREPQSEVEIPPGGSDHIIAETGVSDPLQQQKWNGRPYVIYSPQEVFRDQDFKDVPQGEDHRMARLIREILSPLMRRTGFRNSSARSGTTLDFRRLFRKSVRYSGDIIELSLLRSRPRMKRLHLLMRRERIDGPLSSIHAPVYQRDSADPRPSGDLRLRHPIASHHSAYGSPSVSQSNGGGDPNGS